MELADIVYAAGFFDGEGSINICLVKHSKSGRSYHQLFVTVAQVDPRPLIWLKENWRGSVCFRNPPSNTDTQRPSYRWQVSGPTAAKFLADVQPYLKVKDKEVAIALAFRELKCKLGSQLGQARGALRQQDVHDAREVLRQELLAGRTAQ